MKKMLPEKIHLPQGLISIYLLICAAVLVFMYFINSQRRIISFTVLPVIFIAGFAFIFFWKKNAEKFLIESADQEKKSTRINRIYSVLSNVNQMIVREKDTLKLLNEACSIAVNNGGFRMVWIGMVEPELNVVNVVSSAGYVNNYLDNFTIDLNKTEDTIGIAGKCIKFGKYLICNDIENEKNMVRDTALAVNYKYHSLGSFPIKLKGKIIGAITLYSEQKNFFVQEEIKLLEEMAGDISYAIEFLDNEKERIKIEKELKESEQKYRTLVERSPDGIFIVDFSGNFLSANKAILNSLGLTREELHRTNFKDLIPSGYHDMLLERTQQIMTGKAFLNPVEYEIAKKNGERLYIEIHSVPFIKEGEIFGFQGIARDITEKKKATQLILKSETEFRSVWESSNDAMRLCSEEGIIIKVNKAFCKLFEKPENEFIGNTYQNAYKYKENASQIFKENVAAGKIIPKQEYEIELWNGKKRWLEISNSVFETENKISVLSIFRDISERKEYEALLRSAKERAEEANKTKDLFLANMSHELRTPLIGILGYSDMLAEVLSDNENVEMAKGVQRAGKRLLNTLNLLLDLTKIESDKIDAAISKVNIEDEIKFVFNMFKGIAQERKLDYNLRILSDDLTAEVDTNLVRIILENLINNAIKFTKKGSVTLTTGKENNEYVYVKVEDTGIGIDEKNFEKIFEEFKQISEGLNREFQGTGLGLSITKKYVEVLKGSIKVESKLGKGTVFTVKFPA